MKNAVIIVKGFIHPKMKVLSSFTQSHAVSNLFDFLLWNINVENVGYQIVLVMVTIDFHHNDTK